MTEHYEPSTELIYSYGEDPDMAEGVVSDYGENVEGQEVLIEEEYSPIFQAEEYMKTYSDEERMEMDCIADLQSTFSEKINSSDRLGRELYAENFLGGVFASTPTSEIERQDLPVWKRVLGGSSRGAKVATLAVAMMLPMIAMSKDKKPQKEKEHKEAATPVISSEDRAIQKMGDNIFGKDFLGVKEDRKEWYMEMEREKRSLYRQLERETQIVPRSEEEKSMFKYIETKRDRQLAEIKIQEVKLSKESMKADLGDPAVVAHIEMKTAAINEAKAKVLHDFESEIKRAYGSRKGSNRNEVIEDRINEIERDQKKLINYEIRKTNSYYHSGWRY